MSEGSPVEIMFIVLCSDISLVLRTCQISLHKTIHMISTGDPPFTCSGYNTKIYHTPCIEFTIMLTAQFIIDNWVSQHNKPCMFNFVYLHCKFQLLTLAVTPEKQLCVLQFSAHKDLYVVVNVGQINMTKIKIMKHFNCIKYIMIS